MEERSHDGCSCPVPGYHSPSVVTSPPTLPLADPMAEDYTAHVIPFYKIDANWFAFLVIADTSFQDLAPGGTSIFLTFYDAGCDLVSDATLRLTTGRRPVLRVARSNRRRGQFNGIPPEGVVLLDGRASRFLTYILLVNANDNSLIRIDSIPCQGPLVTPGVPRPCTRGSLTWHVAALRHLQHHRRHLRGLRRFQYEPLLLQR